MEIGNNLIFDREKCWEKMQHERINSCYPFGMLHCTCLSQWISFVYKNVQSFWMSIFHFNEFSIFLSIHLNNSKQTLTNGFQPMLWCDCFELFYHLSEESKQWEAKLSIHLNTDIHFTKTTIDFHTIEPVHFFLYLLFSLSQTWRIYRVVRFVSQLSAICLFHSALFSVFHLCPLDHNFHDTKILLIRYFMRPKLFVWCTRRMRLRNYWILFIVCTIINKWRKKKCVVSVTPKHGGVLYDSYCNSQCYCQYGCLLLLRCWENMSLSRSTATHKTNKKCNLSRRSTSIQIGSNLIRLSSPIDCYLVHLE